MHNNNNRIRLPALLLSAGNDQRVFQQNVWTTNWSIFTVKRDLDIYKNDYVAQKSKCTNTYLKWRPNIQHTNQMYIRKFQEKNSKIYRSIPQKKNYVSKAIYDTNGFIKKKNTEPNFTIQKKKRNCKKYAIDCTLYIDVYYTSIYSQ